MAYAIIRLAAIGLLMTGCARAQTGANPTPNNGVESLYTSLNAKSCTEVPDPNDANGLTYLVCPGVGGYGLQIRTVDSGRLDLSVVTPAKRALPLNYENVVTHSMDGTDEKAEWRVRKENGKVIPIALIVRLLIHGSSADPGKVTRVFWVVAKIDAGKACVTDSIPESSKSVEEVRALADSAAGRACAANIR